MSAMAQQTYSELLLLFFLLISCLRAFFSRSARQDPVACIPLITLLLSILNIFAWGLFTQEIIVFILALSVFIWNFRALLRLNAKLIVDSYSGLFIIASTFNTILILIAAVFIVYFRPVKLDLEKYDVTKTVKAYTGSFSTGFSDNILPFERKTAFVTSYESKKTQDKNKKIILFIPSEASKTQLYDPFFMKLARDGFTVYSADFYCPDAKWFASYKDHKSLRMHFMRFRKLFNQDLYKKATENKTEIVSKQFEALIEIVKPLQNDFVFLVGDEGIHKALFNTQKNATNVCGSFDLADIKSYTTKGYGPLEQTDPFFAFMLSLKRDSSLYMANHLANVLEAEIEKITSFGEL